MDHSYKGFYARIDTPSKDVGAVLAGPDSLVGDDFDVIFKTEEGRVVAWLKNKFGAEVGFFDVDGSRNLQLANARDLKIRALLSFVAYSESDDDSPYWGEVAVFCYNPAHADVFDPFVDRVAVKLAEGIRPEVNLGNQAVEHLFESKDWMPSKTLPMPERRPGVAVLKDRQSMSEKMIEQGRAGNKGCYAISILFLAAVVLGLAYLGARALGIL